MSQPYKKGWLSYVDQVNRLKHRGLDIPEPKFAAQFLAHCNYYRFSGYCLAFESTRHQFRKSVAFEDIVFAFQFDTALRKIILAALEAIEIEFKASVAHHFGKKYGPFGHTNKNNFYIANRKDKKGFNHQKWLDQLHKECRRSSEQFILHYKSHYDGFPDLPVWIATEAMSFGSLSKMFCQGMKNSDRQAIASTYNLQGDTLSSWMHHFVYIRNLCAHHSRLWDRNLSIAPAFPRGKHWDPFRNQHNESRLIATLLTLRYCLKRIPILANFARDWKKQLESHLKNIPSASNATQRMGLQDGWLSSPIWK